MNARVGVILAGGASSRMGQPKERLRLPDGRAMIQAVRDALATTCDRVVVVANDPTVFDQGPVLPDLRPGQGPLAGIEAALAAGSGSEYVICPCDMPRVTREMIERLGGAAETGLAVVLRLEGDDEPQVFPLRLHAAALPIVQRLLDEGRRSVQGLLGLVHPTIVDAPRAWADRFANINTPEEWRSLEDGSA